VFLYLTTKGRVTGLPRTVEIWFVEHAGRHFIVSERREDAGWVKNLLREPAVSFRIGKSGPSREATAEIVRDQETVAKVSALMDEKYGWSEGLIVALSPRRGQA
jgi:deazaflavin-dependent oxidoreductase (nitroreductase family)